MTKKLLSFILKRYQQMSGDKKVRLGLGLSKMAREIRRAGIKATGA